MVNERTERFLNFSVLVGPLDGLNPNRLKNRQTEHTRFAMFDSFSHRGPIPADSASEEAIRVVKYPEIPVSLSLSAARGFIRLCSHSGTADCLSDNTGMGAWASTHVERDV